jgi:hypothetical protein
MIRQAAYRIGGVARQNKTLGGENNDGSGMA